MQHYANHSKTKSIGHQRVFVTTTPPNKNATSSNVLIEKSKLIDFLPKMGNIESYNDFKALCNTSNINISLYNTPLSDDDIETVAKELW